MIQYEYKRVICHTQEDDNKAAEGGWRFQCIVRGDLCLFERDKRPSAELEKTLAVARGELTAPKKPTTKAKPKRK